MRIISLILIMVFSLFSFPAMAYIDPSSGSAIISAIIGFFVAISMTIKTYWYKIRAFFKIGDEADQQKEDNSEKIIKTEKKDS